MIRFNSKGLMVFPGPNQEEIIEKNIIVADECYCPKGHNLVKGKAKFSDFDGIILKIAHEESGTYGLIALSPICGDKTRISIDIDIIKNEIYKFYCPECNSKLPIYSDCSCGGSLLTLFNKPEKDFNDSFCICNRAGCNNAVVNEVEESFYTGKLQTRWNNYK